MPWIRADEWATLPAMTGIHSPSRLCLFILFSLVTPGSKCCPLSSGLNFCASKERWAYVQILWPRLQHSAPLQLKWDGLPEQQQHTHTRTHIVIGVILVWSQIIASSVPRSISKDFEGTPGLLGANRPRTNDTLTDGPLPYINTCPHVGSRPCTLR